MAKTAHINVRTDPETKAEAEKLFASFGIKVNDAINIFLHKAIMEGGLPFEMSLPLDANSEAHLKDIGNYWHFGDFDIDDIESPSE